LPFWAYFWNRIITGFRAINLCCVSPSLRTWGFGSSSSGKSDIREAPISPRSDLHNPLLSAWWEWGHRGIIPMKFTNLIQTVNVDGSIQRWLARYIQNEWCNLNGAPGSELDAVFFCLSRYTI
jgi:hypothetical protein